MHRIEPHFFEHLGRSIRGCGSTCGPSRHRSILLKTIVVIYGYVWPSMAWLFQMIMIMMARLILLYSLLWDILTCTPNKPRNSRQWVQFPRLCQQGPVRTEDGSSPQGFHGNCCLQASVLGERTSFHYISFMKATSCKCWFRNASTDDRLVRIICLGFLLALYNFRTNGSEDPMPQVVPLDLFFVSQSLVEQKRCSTWSMFNPWTHKPKVRRCAEALRRGVKLPVAQPEVLEAQHRQSQSSTLERVLDS